MSAYTKNLSELFEAVGVPNTAAMRVRMSSVLQDVLGIEPGTDDATCSREVHKYWDDPAKRQSLINAVIAHWNGEGDWRAQLAKWKEDVE